MREAEQTACAGRAARSETRYAAPAAAPETVGPVDARFADDVRVGLTASPKSIPCVYFYDARGSELFEQITRRPEYYLTNAEAEIIRERAGEIAELAPDPVQVVELGSGTSEKTVTLLEALLGVNERVVYLPVDVCGHVLTESAATLVELMPELVVRPIRARYRSGLEHVNGDDGPILLLWLGSSIGNLDREQAAAFLECVTRRLAAGDRVLLGVDLMKDRETLEAAYNDVAGVTAEFNLNVLARINRELGGDFDLGRFRHVAVLNEREGRIEMYLESLADQTVSVEALGLSVAFKAGERLHTENSHKYTREQIDELAARAGLTLERQWLDSRGRFSLNILRADGPDAAP